MVLGFRLVQNGQRVLATELGPQSADSPIEQRASEAQEAMNATISQVSVKLNEVSVLLDNQLADLRSIGLELKTSSTPGLRHSMNWPRRRRTPKRGRTMREPSPK
jgi:hypothetical protein